MEPNPIYHRDIRWLNVVRSAEDSSKWFLIDLEDSASPPTLAATHLDELSHCPSVFQNNHGSEVDVWGVGMLIKEFSGSLLYFPQELLMLATIMQSGTLTAAQARESLQRVAQSVFVT